MNSNTEIKYEVDLEMTSENQKLYDNEVEKVHDMVLTHVRTPKFHLKYAKTVINIINSSKDHPKNDYTCKNYKCGVLDNTTYYNKTKYQIYQMKFMDLDLKDLNHMFVVCGERLANVVIEEMPTLVTMTSLVECMVECMVDFISNTETNWSKK